MSLIFFFSIYINTTIFPKLVSFLQNLLDTPRIRSPVFPAASSQKHFFSGRREELPVVLSSVNTSNQPSNPKAGLWVEKFSAVLRYFLAVLSELTPALAFVAALRTCFVLMVQTWTITIPTMKSLPAVPRLQGARTWILAPARSHLCSSLTARIWC